MTRTHRRFSFVVAALLAMTLIVGCSPQASEPAASEPNDSNQTQELKPIKFGTLPTEDALPLWVAQAEGLDKEAGLQIEIVTFPSAAERDIALQSGAIDAFMGDIIAASALEGAGNDVRIATVMLGATPAEGRFGVVAPKSSTAKDMKDLAGVPIGTSSNTIQEYVIDGLMREAGVDAAQVKKEEVKKVPERFALLMAGKLKAAALPEPLLTLAEKQGARLIADDAEGDNLSQTVMVVAQKFEGDEAGSATIDELLSVWDQAVEVINAEPNKWRPTLVEKARLPEPLKDSYQVNTYPKAQQPSQAEVDAILEWMRGKDLLKAEVTYEDLTKR